MSWQHSPHRRGALLNLIAPTILSAPEPYADLCLSRTGVARVGTAGAIYDGKLRGYVPFRDGDTAHTIRVLPCRYATWLAARSSAKENRFGPSRTQPGDASRDFWVPVHKLFDGGECVRGRSLQVTLVARHQNRKIERLHRHLEDEGFPSGFSAADRQNPPFIKEHGLADWLDIFQGGSGLLGPQPQPLAERASFNNVHLTFETPAMSGGSFGNAFSPTLTLESPPPPVRPWPEYAHVRFDVQNGNAVYFGDRANAVADATAGGYRALNISDSTADGWIKATVSGIGEMKSTPAYSLIAAPDFFPAVDQREVFEWWENTRKPTVVPTLPQWLQELIQEGFWDFWRAPPIPLSDERSAPNITLTDSGFDDGDDTVTSIVTPLQRIDLRKLKPATASTQRHAVPRKKTEVREADIIVLGAGPAGCAASIRARQAGFCVVMFDANSKPKASPGETLHPGIEPILGQLGVLDQVLLAGFWRHRGVWIEGGGSRCFSPYGEDGNGPWLGFQADRRTFHRIPQQAAVDAHVTLIQETRPEAVLMEGGRVSGVTVDGRHVRARWTVDATGRSSWLARKLKLPVEVCSPPLGVRFGWHREGVAGLDGQPSFTFRDDGWDWKAPLGDNRIAWVELRIGESGDRPPPPPRRNRSDLAVSPGLCRTQILPHRGRGGCP